MDIRKLSFAHVLRGINPRPHLEGAARGWRVTRLKPTPREWMSMTSVSQSDPKGWLTGLWDRQDTWHSLGKDFISPYLAVQIGLLCIFWLGFKVCYMPANLLQQRRRTTAKCLPRNRRLGSWLFLPKSFKTIPPHSALESLVDVCTLCNIL